MLTSWSGVVGWWVLVLKAGFVGVVSSGHSGEGLWVKKFWRWRMLGVFIVSCDLCIQRLVGLGDEAS